MRALHTALYSKLIISHSVTKMQINFDILIYLKDYGSIIYLSKIFVPYYTEFVHFHKHT